MIRLSRFGWCGIALVLLAPWIILLWLLHELRLPNGAEKNAPAAANSSRAVPKIAPQFHAGPWGKLEYRSIAIEPPEEFIPSDYKPAAPRWFLGKTTPAQLEALWDAAKLTPEQRASLSDPQRRNAAADGIVLSPDPELVLNLSPDARSTIYTMLAAIPQNDAQREPFRFRGQTDDEWFAESELPDDIVALTKRLIYRRHGTSFFSDFDLVLPQIPDSSTRTKYLKTLSRKSAFMITLHLDRDTDIDPIAQYWGRGRRGKDVKPLLQSLVRQPEGADIDIVHLVPRFPRSLLYTFPLPSTDANAVNRDCHWTSFNFAKDEPDDRFTDIEFVKQTLLSDYYPIAGEPQLGDIYMFVQEDGVVVHSCVHIADDIVFTKNGPSFAVPWQFARLELVLSFYSVGSHQLEVRRYRAKSQ